MRNSSPDEALRYGRELLDAGNASADVARLTATAALRLGRHADTVAILTPLLAREPDNTACLALRANAHLALGLLSEAAEGYRAIAGREPQSRAAWTGLLRVKARGGNAGELPRNLMIVNDEVAHAWRARDLGRTEALIAELHPLDAITSEYWRLVVEDRHSRIADPVVRMGRLRAPRRASISVSILRHSATPTFPSTQRATRSPLS
jgi:tetratricopeptide (TPR) repeat protein